MRWSLADQWECKRKMKLEVSRMTLRTSTNIAKISRKWSKPDNHGHGKGKRIQEPEECYQSLSVIMGDVLISGLDADNPLCLHSNDLSNLPIVNVKLTRSENYKMWSTAMTIALTGKNKMGFVDGTCVKPATSVVHCLEMESSHAINILAREPFSDVKEAFNVISMEESHRGLHHGSGSGNKVQPAVFVAKTNNFIGNDFRRGNNGNGPLYNKHTANQHLTISTKNMFNITDIASLNLNVGHPNETLAKITAIGNLRLSANVVLFDVLVVPEYCVSLMSVHKLIKDSKLFVVFNEHKCYIQDLNLVKTVRIGIESGGLYLFDEDQIGESKYGLSNSIFVCNVSKQLWHNRLSHPSDQVLSILSKSIKLKYGNHISPCDIYHKAKQTREPFHFSNHKSMSIGDPVHLDLWGPYRVVSRDGYKYFLIVVVDDFSRAMWDYLIKSKDEVGFFIESYVELINT
ncbi:ribonuclease H-like domain-containing protein [Tanacetum coccineum]